jgi:hypothetical protein
MLLLSPSELMVAMTVAVEVAVVAVTVVVAEEDSVPGFP